MKALALSLWLLFATGVFVTMDRNDPLPLCPPFCD